MSCDAIMTKVAKQFHHVIFNVADNIEQVEFSSTFHNGTEQLADAIVYIDIKQLVVYVPHL